MWGLGYRFTHDVVENAPAIAFFPTVLDHNLFSAFVQDEIALAAQLALTLGSKVEHNDYTGFEFEPNVRLQWTWRPNQTLWSAISRAARTPSRIDRDLAEPAPPAPVILQGGSNYGSEYVTAYELGLPGPDQLDDNRLALDLLQRVSGCAQCKHYARHRHSALLRQQSRRSYRRAGARRPQPVGSISGPCRSAMTISRRACTSGPGSLISAMLGTKRPIPGTRPRSARP